MNSIFAQMAALVLCGVALRRYCPADLNADELRRAIGALVYYLLLPALVLQVLWRAPVGLDSLRIAGLAAAGVLACLALAIAACRLCALPRPLAGAMILASAFPNVTYLGLPVLDATFGTWARSVAIQYDLFACLPLLLTVGVLVAQAYGEKGVWMHPLRALMRVPALWAALLAVILGRLGALVPLALDQTLSLMGNAVVPLMLIALGMSLRFDAMHKPDIVALLPVIAIQLLFMPALVSVLSSVVGVAGELRAAVVMEAAMPSMVLGIVICERYGLDRERYAAAATATTVLSLFTLPLWLAWMR